jgi:hypothetical protein
MTLTFPAARDSRRGRRCSRSDHPRGRRHAGARQHPDLSGRRLRTRSTYAKVPAGRVIQAGFTLLATFDAPHYSIVWPAYNDQEAERLAQLFDIAIPNPHYIKEATVSSNPQVRISLPADVNQVDDTGYVWTFADSACEPERIRPGALIVAGDEVEPFLARVTDIVQTPSGREVVHLDVLGVPDEAIEELRHARLIA